MGSRSWTITINNYTEDEMEFITQRFAQLCTRLVVGKEVGDEGTPHLQGFCILRRVKRMAAMKKLFPRAHLEKSNADAVENHVYCTKPGEEGTVDTIIDFKSSFQGQRNDITDFYESAKEVGLKRAAMSDPSTYVKYHKGLTLIHGIYQDSLVSYNARYETFKMDIMDIDRFTIIWGPSGIGKTQWALAHFKNPLMCSDIEDLRKYDPAVNDGVVFDDMDFSHIPRTAIIHLVDSEYRRSIHMRHYNWDKPAGLPMIATTNNHGGNIFGQYYDDPAIVRRIRVVSVEDGDLYD